MDAASRPKPEPLTDLPLEASVDDALSLEQPEPAAPPEETAEDLERASLDFNDPAMYLPPSDSEPSVSESGSHEVVVVEPGDEPVETLEMELEDPVVDELLEPEPLPLPPRPATASPAPAHSPMASAAGSTSAPAADSHSGASARVPLARTASLTAAATKLAAASAAAQRSSVRANATAAASVSPLVHAARPTPAAAEGAAATPEQSPSADTALSYAAWTSARSSAMDAPRGATAPVASAASAATGATGKNPALTATGNTAKNPVLPAAVTTGKNGGAAPAPTPVGSPSMDRDFIARNQVVERYLSGRLPLKGATDFERYCRDHPELLDEIGLPERVHAGVRLLEASGKPEPWQEAARPAWQKPQVTIGLLAAVGVLIAALAIVAGGSAAKTHRIADLQKQSFERPLEPATSTRKIRVLPSRDGASNAPAITIGGGEAQLVDFRIDESRSPYHFFRVTIDRIDQGRMQVINNLAKDSNGQLHLAFNSSALGPGNYLLTIEGLNMHGDPEPDSWITIGVSR